MQKFQIILIAILIGCFAFISCERAQTGLQPAVDDVMTEDSMSEEMIDDADTTGDDGMMDAEEMADDGMMDAEEMAEETAEETADDGAMDAEEVGAGDAP